MQTINIKKIIKDHNLSTKEVAWQLFPTNKYPSLALSRIISGEAVLDANQISKLASLANITIAELYGQAWKAKTKGNIMTFTSKGYKAELNTKTWTTKIFDNNSLFHESVIHAGSTPLNQYLIMLNEIITDRK